MGTYVLVYSPIAFFDGCDIMVKKEFFENQVKTMKPILLYPAFKDYLWGGTRLQSVYPDCAMSPLAEAWVLSCHADGPSIIADTTPAVSLSSLLQQQPELVGSRGQQFPFFPILIKLIDAKKPLSVQVHPDDVYAMQHENGFGKTEMWYVLDCEPGAVLYYGFQHEISKEEFTRRIEDNTLTDVLQAVEVHKGDVFFIPAGTIHAIGAGMLIAEIQQNSNTTYRVYDYGRLGADGKPRALHIEKALDVTALKPAASLPTSSPDILASCPYFTVERLRTAVRRTIQADAFHALLVVEGEAILSYDEGEMQLTQYDCVFLPAGMGEYSVTGTFEILDITI